MRGLMIAFCGFCLHCESKIASADAAAYSVLLLDALSKLMIVNRRKTRNSHLIDTRNQNQSYGIYNIYKCKNHSTE